MHFFIHTFSKINYKKETLALRHLNWKKWRDLVVSEDGLTFDRLHSNCKLRAHCPAPLNPPLRFKTVTEKLKLKTARLKR